MEFDITKVVYVKSNGELSSSIEVGTVGYVADSIANLQKIVEYNEKDIMYGILIDIDTLKERDFFMVSEGKYKFNGTYFYPTGMSKYRPYTWEEISKFLGKTIKRKDDNYMAIITAIKIEEGILFINDISVSYLLENYTWLDGTPCGVFVKE